MIYRHFRGILPLVPRAICRDVSTTPRTSYRLISVLKKKDNDICVQHLKLPSRTFSSQNTQETSIVDYEYVKNALSNKDIYLIDVREPNEIKENGKIPNSFNIPITEVENALGSMSEKEFESKYKRTKPSHDTPIIFYCKIGRRSGMAYETALNLGYEQLKNYVGSWTDWVSKTK